MQWDNMTEHSGSAFKTPWAKVGARALLNEQQEPSAMLAKLWWCYQPPCPSGSPTKHSSGPPACSTPVSCWESQASTWLWWGNSFWVTPPPPLFALPWSATGHTPTREPCADCSGAACSSGVRINQRWDGTKEEWESKPESGYILSPVSHQLQRDCTQFLALSRAGGGWQGHSDCSGREGCC